MNEIKIDGGLAIRRAVSDELEVLDELAAVAMQVIEQRGYSPEQVEAMRELTVMDPTLIEDGTYYVAELDGRIVASGGWSRRKGFCTRDNTREATFADPATDAARVRGMYTHPDFVRRGFAQLLLQTVEIAAKLKGFSRAELLATPAGRLLYFRTGWEPLGEVLLTTANGCRLPALHMSKRLA